MHDSVAAALILSAAQMKWAILSYQIGEVNGQGFTVAALSWQESSFCDRMRNNYSVGCMGTKRRTVRKLFDAAATRLRLATDEDYSIRAGAAILDYCRIHTKNWRREIACYHFGEPTESQMSDAQIDSDPYVLSVAAKVRALEGVKQNHE